MPLVSRPYRSPQREEVATKEDEEQPLKPISQVGGGRSGALIAFAQAAQSGVGHGR